MQQLLAVRLMLMQHRPFSALILKQPSRFSSAATTTRGTAGISPTLTFSVVLESTEAPCATELAIADGTRLLQGRFSESLGEIARHGPGDACITLNVGGKEFYTLRSTVNSNAVLADHVARAEANKEVTKNGAVFVDRDPEHFIFILKHLRNRMDLQSTTTTRSRILEDGSSNCNMSSLTKFTKAYMELPKDPKALRELYVEAAFYRIPELQSALCESSISSTLASMVNNKGNPFDAAARLLGQFKAAALAVGAFGGTVLVTANDGWDWALQKVEIRKQNT
jgi:hypothetical protein